MHKNKKRYLSGLLALIYLTFTSPCYAVQDGDGNDISTVTNNSANFFRVRNDTPTDLFTIIGDTGNVGVGDSSPAALFTVGSGDKFRVDGNGNLIRINNVPYTWPGADSAGVLTSDGAGNLTWSAATVG